MDMNPGPQEDRARVLARIVQRHQGVEGALLPILHDLQDSFGHLPADLLPALAETLSISRAELHGVISFYHDFRMAPAGRHRLQICRAEACQAMGANALADHARDRLGLDWHATSADGAVTLEPVFCLGLCACGPAAMLDGRLVGRLDLAGLDDLLAQVRE